MISPEGKVKAKVKAILEKRGAYYFMPRGTAFGRAGVPDIIGCIDGRFFGIECKAGNNKTSMLQDMERESIRKAGGVSIVVNENNIDAVDQLCDFLMNYATLMRS